MLDEANHPGEHGPAGPVRIATMEGIASLYLSEHFVRFNQTQPDISIELATSEHNVRVSQREADIFLGFFEPEGRDLDVRKLGEFKLGLYASAAYLASTKSCLGRFLYGGRFGSAFTAIYNGSRVSSWSWIFSPAPSAAIMAKSASPAYPASKIRY